MRPAVPVPGTNCNSMPRSQARRRTAGEATGLSPGARTSAAGALARRVSGAGGSSATSLAAKRLAHSVDGCGSQAPPQVELIW